MYDSPMAAMMRHTVAPSSNTQSGRARRISSDAFTPTPLSMVPPLLLAVLLLLLLPPPPPRPPMPPPLVLLLLLLLLLLPLLLVALLTFGLVPSTTMAVKATAGK
jgi:hypothetical protein